MHVDARLDAPLSRWLWLVKWLLSIPHWIVLAFLWIAFVALSIVAFFAILFTGRYPRAIFDFNVGVLRWSWRVSYYSYGALGTDRYPPFSLGEEPDYPATLSVDYPDHLSRGLVLVKWWLLAIPHYIIVGFFMGGGAYAAWHSDSWTTQSGGGGLIGIIVLVAAVVLLFTGAYPKALFDFVLGMNRWVLRVAAYAGLMTDAYPPFRFDMGGTEPGGTMTMPPPAPPTGGAPYASQPPMESQPGTGPVTGPQPTSRWTTGRIVAVALGALAALIGSGLLVGGGAVLWVDRTQRDDAGYVMTSTEHLSTTTYALTSGSTDLRAEGPRWAYASHALGKVKVEATGASGHSVFVGIARSTDVETYLSGVGHARVTGWNATPKYDVTSGDSPTAVPADAIPWVAKAEGTGTQTATWKSTSGSWTVVVMNADGSAPVVADVALGATLPILGAIIAGLLIGGLVLVLVGAVAIILAVRGATRS
jgi:hypothetical protein